MICCHQVHTLENKSFTKMRFGGKQTESGAGILEITLIAQQSDKWEFNLIGLSSAVQVGGNPLFKAFFVKVLSICVRDNCLSFCRAIINASPHFKENPMK